MTRVAVSFPYGTTVTAPWHLSMQAMYSHEGDRIGRTIAVHSGVNISRARNEQMRRWLDDGDEPWMFLTDTDMVFTPNVITALLASNRKLVGALTFSWVYDEGTATMQALPTIMDQDPGDGWPEDQLVETIATGAACLLVHREVATAVRERWSGARPWFDEVAQSTTYDDVLSEDVTFCLRAKSVGFPTFVNTAVQVGHVKPIVVTAQEYELRRRLSSPEAAAQASMQE